MASDDASAFNRSTRTPHSPPQSVSSKGDEMRNIFVTETSKVACNRCEHNDASQKIRCGFCNRWWHSKCVITRLPSSNRLKSALWKCNQCDGQYEKYDKAHKDKTPFNGTRVEIGSEQLESTRINPPISSPLPGTEDIHQSASGNENNNNPPITKSIEPASDKSEATNATNPNKPPKATTSKNVDDMLSKSGSRSTKSHSSKSSRNSRRQATIELLNKEAELRKTELQVEAEEQLLALQLKKKLIQIELENTRRIREILKRDDDDDEMKLESHKSSVKLDATENASSLVKQWVDNSMTEIQLAADERSTKRSSALRQSQPKTSYRQPPRETTFSFGNTFRRGVSIMNPNITVDEFVNSMVSNIEDDETRLSSSQIRARTVSVRDLPEFNGDPVTWPNFASRFAESTKRCGYTEAENLERLSKCLRGDALKAVEAELNRMDALSSIISTLRMRFGRPEVVYAALVRKIRDGPQITERNLEAIVPFSLSIKSLCDTLKTAELQDYLYNALLLMDLVEKLPSSYRIMWGNYVSEYEERGNPANLDTFNTWLRKQADIYTATHQLKITTQPERPRTGTKPKVVSSFQGMHSNEELRKGQRREWCHYCRKVSHLTSRCPELLKLTVEDRWATIKKFKLCLKCLGQHSLRSCGSEILCGVDGCDRVHHKILHSTYESSKVKPTSTSLSHEFNTTEAHEAESPREQRPSRTKNVFVHQNFTCKFQIVPVILSNNDEREVKTYALLDNGSEITMIKEELAKKLKLNGPNEPLRLKWSDDTVRSETKSQKVQVSISDIKRTETFHLRNVRTVNALSLPTQSMSYDELRMFHHLKTIPFEEYQDATPEMLIGIDNYQLLTPQETIEGGWNEPAAIRTRIGWTIYGKITQSDAVQEVALNTHLTSNEELKELVEKYFAHESIGITAPKIPVESVNDARARYLMESSVKQEENGRYSTRLLWKDDKITMPNSLPMALSRLRHFERKLAKTNMREKVNNIIREYHESGYLVELTQEEIEKTTTKTWYLPMFTVENPNKPGKIRVVWDAAAEVKGVSLNSKLLTGPDLTASLNATLFKFREHKYAVSGDIEKMFHQIYVATQDQDSQRCLWRENSSDDIRTSRMAVMTFGAACSPSIAQFVKNKNASKFEDQYPRATEAITERHYVDDYLDSFQTLIEAKQVLSQVVNIHKAGGFNLRGIISNATQISEDYNKDGQHGGTKNLLTDTSTNVKVLGMWWNTSDDSLQYQLNTERIGEDLLSGDITPTKRQVLRVLMMMFDPLGLIGYISLKGKLVLKAIWRTPVEWDEQIHSNEFDKWKEWLSDIKRLPEIKINRWYFSTPSFTHYELHVFVDAGEDASAAVAYIVGCHDNAREATLVSSKTKVGPNKPTSIPRMELQAAVIGSRLAATITNQHSIYLKETIFWTDSRNVLCWLRSPKRFKIFVAHRVGEIRENTKVRDWRYVPTKDNPADIGTKWVHHTEPMPHIWSHGPSFLEKPQLSWPKEPENLPPIEEEVLEIRCHLNMINTHSSLCPPIEHFSSLNRLVRAQAQVLRFFKWGKTILNNEMKKKLKSINSEDIVEAKYYLIREDQQQEFSEEFRDLKAQGSVNKRSKIRQYSPFEDQHGLIRSKSRLQNAEYLTYEQRCPIILPKNSHLTILIIREAHERCLHQNHAIVLNELKQVYVIPALRAALKSLRANCTLCRKRSIRPETPEMSPLPRSRLAVHMKPFTHTGVDYFGPILVKHGRRIEKKWGVIFTCLTTRAIHLELASSLSSDAFLLVLRCFSARRGTPSDIYCDNGTNFHGAANELKKIVIANTEHISTTGYQNITFHFNPPHAPHMGGAWERLIRAVKAAFKCLITERIPSEDMVRTTLSECEMMVNSRPLTYVNLDEDSLEALTPNHFILGSSNGTKPVGDFTDDPGVLRHEWKRQQVVVAIFWKRFINEYLPQISQRTKWYDKVDPLRTGDIVAIANSKEPGSWQLGRVVQTIASSDGGVRQAEIRTANGLVRRPASMLAILVRDLRSETISSAGGGVA